MNKVYELAAPLGRILISLMFVMSGVMKIGGYSGTQAYMESMGVPGVLLPFAIATEILGGIAIIVGWQTRLAALALAGFCIVSGVLFHGDFTDQTQMIMFLKNITITGGFFILVAMGPGAYALDNRKKGD